MDGKIVSNSDRLPTGKEGLKPSVFDRIKEIAMEGHRERRFDIKCGKEGRQHGGKYERV